MPRSRPAAERQSALDLATSPSPAAGAAPPGTFAARVIAWQRGAGRHGLPWQRSRDPYAVWLSEIMLQQTQVATVIPYYERFLAAFPDVAALAAAPDDEVLRLWAGLGYYSRARNLHRCAREVVARHGGRFPSTAAELAGLPGIGRSTAAAIAAFCFGERAAILDGNVKRVFCRRFGVEGFPGERAVEQALWAIALRELPARDVDVYTQGLMDLGATLCTRGRPDCARCPVRDDCVALATGRVDRLPAPRPRKAVPLKAARLWVLLHGDAVLIERRPAPGIWGGLWSLPQTEADAIAPPGDLAARIDDRAVQALPTFTHAFTHFRLAIEPMRVTIEGRAAGEMAQAGESGAAGRRWLPLAEVAEAGLPRPVKSLLGALAERSSTQRSPAQRSPAAGSMK